MKERHDDEKCGHRTEGYGASEREWVLDRPCLDSTNVRVPLLAGPAVLNVGPLPELETVDHRADNIDVPMVHRLPTRFWLETT